MIRFFFMFLSIVFYGYGFAATEGIMTSPDFDFDNMKTQIPSLGGVTGSDDTGGMMWLQSFLGGRFLTLYIIVVVIYTGFAFIKGISGGGAMSIVFGLVIAVIASEIDYLDIFQTANGGVF